MIKVRVDNRHVVFDAPPRHILKRIDDRTSYFIDGFYHVQAYKKGFWDGRERLMKKVRGQDAYRLPSGLVDEVVAVCSAMGCPIELVDARRRPTKVFEAGWSDRYPLRDYQESCVRLMLEERGLLDGMGMIDISPRGGKTVIAAAITGRLGVRTLVCVQSEIALEQVVNVFHGALGIPIGIVGGGQFDDGPNVVVATCQTLTTRNAETWVRGFLGSFDAVIFDECFVAETPIQTPAGVVPIESVREGDAVLTYDEASGSYLTSVVTDVFRRVSSDLYRVTFDDGEEFVCTGSHPWFTQDGWTLTASLASGATIESMEAAGGVDRNNVRGLRHGRGADGSEEDLQVSADGKGLLFPGVFQRVCLQAFVGDDGRDEQEVRLRTDEEAQPDAGSRGSQEGVEDAQEEQAPTSGAGWQREANAEATGRHVGRSWGGMGTGVCGSDSHEPREGWSTDPLQDRRCAPETQGGGGNRRLKPYLQESAEVGCQERRLLGVEWMGGREGHECRRVRSVERLSPADPVSVFNFEVEGTHTYLVGKRGYVVHNCHHIRSGERWRSVILGCDAYHKIAMSGTIYLHKKSQAPKDTIWMRATCGPVRFKLTPSDLIHGGWLVAPKIDLVRVSDPKVDGDWPTVKKQGIIEHSTRNELLLARGCHHMANGTGTVFTADTLSHVTEIVDTLRGYGFKVAPVIGKTTSASRRSLIRDFKRGKLVGLVGTVFGEAVDIPEIGCVVVMEGGESKVRCMQRFRCMTASKGKTTAYLVDSMDMHNKILAKHSLARLKTYREHEMFMIGTVS